MCDHMDRNAKPSALKSSTAIKTLELGLYLKKDGGVGAVS